MAASYKRKNKKNKMGKGFVKELRVNRLNNSITE